MKLNEKQLAFLNDTSKYQRILAPAGSGKTTLILEKIAQIINQEKDSVEILFITFTNTAREEAQKRLKDYPKAQEQKSKITIQTLNSFGWNILKKNIHQPILINEDRNKFDFIHRDLQFCWKRNNFLKRKLEKEKKNDRIYARKIIRLIDSFKSLVFLHRESSQKNFLFTHVKKLYELKLTRQVIDLLEQAEFVLDELFEKAKNFDEKLEILFEKFYIFYQQACKKARETSKFTYEDQKYFAYLILLEKKIESIKGLSKYSHIFVDEFQDINLLDLELIKLLQSKTQANLYIVGDDDQAIFEWRGASPHFIVEPDKVFEQKFQTHIFENNYRTPKNLLEHSQKLIICNQVRVPKKIIACNTNEARIELSKHESTYQSMKYTMELISKWAKNFKTSANSTIAVLSRKRAQLIPYQIFFTRENIHFVCPKDLNILLSKTFTELLAILEIKDKLSNLDKLSQVEIVNYLLQVVNKVFSKPLSREVSHELRNLIYDHLDSKNYIREIDLYEVFDAYCENKKKSSEEIYSNKIYDSMSKFLDATYVYEILIVIAESFSGFAHDKDKAEDDIFFADPPFYYLSDYAYQYEKNLKRFISDLKNAQEKIQSLLAHKDEKDEIKYKSQQSQQKNPIYILTALRAKGREFDHVIILDAVEGIWPTQTDYLEEERRLFYVALTRAKQELTVLLPSKKSINNLEPSRFLKESKLM